VEKYKTPVTDYSEYMFCGHCGASMPEGSRFCEQCGYSVALSIGTDPTLHTASATGANNYLSLIEPRLKLGGFTILRNVPVTPWRVDLVATQTSGNVLTYKLLRVILATAMDRVDEQTIRNYSGIMSKYAQDTTGTATVWRSTTVVIYPVIITRNVPDAMKMWLKNTAMEKHFAAFEFPVLALTDTREIIFLTKTPFYGWALYKGFRKFAETSLVW
jgi:hypothetical protein